MTVSENLMIALAIANNRALDALTLMDTPELRSKLDNVLSRYKLEPHRDATVSALAQRRGLELNALDDYDAE